MLKSKLEAKVDTLNTPFLPLGQEKMKYSIHLKQDLIGNNTNPSLSGFNKLHISFIISV
jgi:hypothetical protein